MAARGSILGLCVLALYLLYCDYSYVCIVVCLLYKAVDSFFLNHSFFEAFRSKFTNFVCESFNESWVTIKECRLRAVSRNKTTLTTFVFVTEPAYDIFVRIRVLKKANGYKPWIMDYLIDGCKFMRQRHHPFGKILWNFVKDVSTINHSCPYVVSQEARS